MAKHQTRQHVRHQYTTTITQQTRSRKKPWVRGVGCSPATVPPEHLSHNHSHAVVVADHRADRAPVFPLRLSGSAGQVHGEDDGSEADRIVQHGKPEHLAEPRSPQ